MSSYNIVLNGLNTGTNVVEYNYANGNRDTINILVGPGIDDAYVLYAVYGDSEDRINVFYSPGVNVTELERTIVYLGTTSQADIGIIAIDASIGTVTQVCFTAGTRVQTPNGPVRIEDLTEGDLVLTRDHGAQPLRWIGQSRLTAETLRAHPHLRPIRIAAGALGDNGETMVSPAHRMLVTGWRAEALAGEAEVLAAAKALVNDTTITTAHDVDEVNYVHLMFDAHELILADGVWSESFHPAALSQGTAGRAAHDEVVAIFPELEQRAATRPVARPDLDETAVRVLRA